MLKQDICFNREFNTTVLTSSLYLHWIAYNTFKRGGCSTDRATAYKADLYQASQILFSIPSDVPEVQF